MTALLTWLYQHRPKALLKWLWTFRLVRWLVFGFLALQIKLDAAMLVQILVAAIAIDLASITSMVTFPTCIKGAKLLYDGQPLPALATTTPPAAGTWTQDQLDAANAFHTLLEENLTNAGVTIATLTAAEKTAFFDALEARILVRFPALAAQA